MKSMINIELERAFRSTSFWIAILIGIIITALQFIQQVIPAAMNPIYWMNPIRFRYQLMHSEIA